MPKEIIPSPVTGVLTQIAFSGGELVEAGATVAFVESMKMLYPVLSENNGYISYYASEGALVAMDDAIAEIDLI